MVKYDPRPGKYMACLCYLCRGDVVPKDVNAASLLLRQRGVFNSLTGSRQVLRLESTINLQTVVPVGDLAIVAVCCLYAIQFYSQARLEHFESLRSLVRW